jgi:hypothetical protein
VLFQGPNKQLQWFALEVNEICHYVLDLTIPGKLFLLALEKAVTEEACKWGRKALESQVWNWAGGLRVTWRTAQQI